MFKRLLKHKYGAKSTTIDDVKFPSLLEGRCYKVLKRMQSDGQIRMFLLQPRFELGKGLKHRADFQVFTDEHVIFIEAKGRDLEAGRIRRLMAESLYNIDIHVVKKESEIETIIRKIKEK